MLGKTKYEQEFDRYLKQLEHRKEKQKMLSDFVVSVEKLIYSGGFAPGHEFYKLESDGGISMYIINYICINHFAECGSRIIYLYWCGEELKSFNDGDIGLTVFESKEAAVKYKLGIRNA